MKRFTIFLLLILATMCGSTGCDDSKDSKKYYNNSESESDEYESESRLNAKRNISISNLKQIGLALCQYAYDNREKFPGANSRGSAIGGLDTLFVNEYLTDTSVYITPYDKAGKPAEGTTLNPAENCSYVYIRGLIAGNYGSDFPLVFEKPWRLPKGTDKICVMFADGSARIYTIPGVTKMNCRQVFEAIVLQTFPPLLQTQEYREKIIPELQFADAIR